MFKYLDTWKEAKQLATDELKAFVQDTSKDLKERWEVFQKYGEGLAKTEGFYYDFDNVIPSNVTERLINEPDRYRIYETSELIEALEDMVGKTYTITKYGENYTSYPENYLITEEVVAQAKEKVLSDFVYDFEYDW
jgi:hypothetical protein